MVFQRDDEEGGNSATAKVDRFEGCRGLKEL